MEKRKRPNMTEEDLCKYMQVKEKSNDSFVWKKKILRDFSQGLPLSYLLSKKARRRRQDEIKSELQKLKRRKDVRAIEKATHEEEAAILAKERARIEFQDIEKKDHEFQFEQSKLKSKIRLLQGRPKAIDILRGYLCGMEPIDICLLFKGLVVNEVEELRTEIQMHIELDRENICFWQALMVVCESELSAEQTNFNSTVASDVDNLLQGKTYKELEALECQIESDMHSGRAKVVEFWEDVTKSIHIYKAKACLKEIHTKLFPLHLQHEVKSQKDDITIEENMEMKDIKTMEINLDPQKYSWNEKYQPRKPLYNNHILTGYEWNKYNRTHYDHENPPPATVQGYKFNIFYPDLVNKSKIPQFIIEKDGDNIDTCIIRFHAGPPYEDIAFRIGNKDWKKSNKDGFKCTFENGILQLHFKFQRYCYRR